MKKAIKKTISLFLILIMVTFISIPVVNAASDEILSKTLMEMLPLIEDDVAIPVWIWLLNEGNDAKIESLMSESICFDIKNSMLSAENTTDIKESVSNIVDADSISEYITTKRNIVSNVYAQQNTEFSANFLSSDEILFQSQYAPVIIANLTAERINQIAAYEQVIFIDYYSFSGETSDYSEPDSIESVNASYDTNTITEVNSAKTLYNLNGTGIKIGVIDGGKPQVVGNANLSGIKISYSPVAVDRDISNHATNVLGIIYSIAPKATYYYASYFSLDSNGKSTNETSFITELEWLLDNGVNVINASVSFVGSKLEIDKDGDGVIDFTHTLSDSFNVYGSAARYLDILVYNSDVTFVKTSGNEGVKGVNSGGMAYNVITVGNYDDKGTASYSDDTIQSQSSYYNTESDVQHKPDICAPGTNVTISGKVYGTGTSYAAPQITGIVALMMQKNSALKTAPDDVKAILTAGVNMETSHHYVPAYCTGANSYKVFGAGLVNAKNAMKILANGNYYSAAMLSSQTEKTYTVTVTSDMVGKTIRVAMAVTKYYPELNDAVTSSGISTSYALANLDLYAYFNNVVQKMSTTKNNIEIIEFKPAKAGTYTIKIKKVSAPSITTYFGAAYYVS